MYAAKCLSSLDPFEALMCIYEPDLTFTGESGLSDVASLKAALFSLPSLCAELPKAST